MQSPTVGRSLGMVEYIKYQRSMALGIHPDCRLAAWCEELVKEVQRKREMNNDDYTMKSDEINARNADQSIKNATDVQLQKVRGDIDEDASSARERNDDWRNANIPGATDDWIPGLRN